MSVDVSVQSAFVAILQSKLSAAEQAAYLAVFPGTRVSVVSQSAYLALFNPTIGPVPSTRPRRIVTVVSS